MEAIVCIDENFGIGKNNNLLISIPDDMKHFRDITNDNIIIMGRKTLFSFPKKEPLKNRINIVFTHDIQIKNDYKNFENIFFVENEIKLNNILSNYKSKKHFIIGGGIIYNMFINKCDILHITKIYKNFDADTFFPNPEKYSFRLKNSSPFYYYNDIKYNFLIYGKQ